MHSSTKRWLTKAEIEELVRAGLGSDVKLAEQRELVDGAFNAVYAVDLTDGRELVLKVAPPPELKLLRYEVDLMHIEVEFYQRAAAVGVPLPRLYAADPERGYLLVERLPGRSLAELAPAMPPPQLASLRRELAEHCAKLTGVVGSHFGYPRRDGHTRSDSWSRSFLVMIDDILADAEEYDRELPAAAASIGRLVRGYAALLDEVTTPVLVHFDLWDGNVFVTPTDAGFQVAGIIDGERAFYGDRLAELVSMALFTDPEQVPGLLPGFVGRELTHSERTRVRLYTVYLYLIMVTEGATRGFDPAEHEPVRRLVLGKLSALIVELERDSPR